MSEISENDSLVDEFWVVRKTGLSVNTIRWFRYTGEGGPRYVKLGRRVRYLPSDVDAWIASSREAVSAGVS